MPGLHFEFVSPETVLFSGDVDQVDRPGMEGDLGVLPGHAPMVTTLRPGIITIFRDGNREPVVVVGGFAEMSPAGLTVLADRAGSREGSRAGLTVPPRDGLRARCRPGRPRTKASRGCRP